MITGEFIVFGQFGFWIRQQPIIEDEDEDSGANGDASTQDSGDPAPPPTPGNSSAEEVLDTDGFVDIDEIEIPAEKPKTAQKRHADSATIHTLPSQKKKKHTGIGIMGMVEDSMLALTYYSKL